MRAILTLILGGLLLAGCQTQQLDPPLANSVTLQPPPTLPTHRRQPQSAPPGKGAAFDVDDCAARMQTLEGQLLLYYYKYQKLPTDLDELRSVADPLEEVPLECPVSHKPYVYNPAGLILGNDPDRRLLIVYDSVPAHGGSRWGIIFRYAAGKRPPTTDVIQIPEQSMAGYHPAPPMAPERPIQTPGTITQHPVIPQQ